MQTRLGILLTGILLVSSLGAGCIDSSGSGDGPGSAGSGSGQNQAPTSFFTFDCHHTQCSFDGTRSSDGDGSITSYHWRFGDGTEAKGAFVDHTYTQSGDYTVTLRVRDTGGAEDTSRRDVPVSKPEPGHTHGDDEGDPEPQDLPDDYHYLDRGPVTPSFEANWTFPVNDSSAALVHVNFNITSETFPAGVAHNVTLNLTDPSGERLRDGTVGVEDPRLDWNVTDAARLGAWTLQAAGQGLGGEDLDGTEYVLEVDVYYGTAP